MAEAQPGIWYGDRTLHGDLTLEQLFGYIGSATIADVSGLYAQHDLEWILEYLAAGQAQITSSMILLNVTDTIPQSATQYIFILPGWNESGGAFYKKAFSAGTPIVRYGPDSELTPYVHLLDGAVIGSHRGFTILFDGAADRKRLRIWARLESISNNLTLADLANQSNRGMAPRTTPITRITGIMRR